jgi:xanthine dehydrogenase accessory factor
MIPFPWNVKITIIGAGDRGTAAALRLFHSGFQPVLVERPQPSDLHFIRTFSDVIYCERKTIENVPAAAVIPTAGEKILSEQIQEYRANRIIPVINKQDFTEHEIVNKTGPDIVIDCTRPVTSKLHGADLEWQNFSCVIRIGFTFTVGLHGHYVIGDTPPYSGMVFHTAHNIVPENLVPDNIFKSPLEGVFQTAKRIGDTVQEREKIGMLNDINILAPYNGYITGLLHSGHFVLAGQPLFELQRYQKSREALSILPVNCRSIAGGILEAVLKHLSSSI